VEEMEKAASEDGETKGLGQSWAEVVKAKNGTESAENGESAVKLDESAENGHEEVAEEAAEKVSLDPCSRTSLFVDFPARCSHPT
jgi:hypothetical protein